MDDKEHIPRITKDQYGLWKNSPVTRTIFKYLECYRDQVRREHCERWEQGTQDDQLESRALGVVIFTDNFLTLSFDAIEEFLNTTTEQEE